MEPVRHVAEICVGRAVLFGSLAIILLMVAFSFDPVLAFKCGAITTLLMSAILTFKALQAHAVPPRRTEAWFARTTLIAACGFFASSLLLDLLGVQPFAFAAH